MGVMDVPTGSLIMWCETHGVHFGDTNAQHSELRGCDVFNGCSTGTSVDTHATCGGKGKQCVMKGLPRTKGMVR